MLLLKVDPGKNWYPAKTCLIPLFWPSVLVVLTTKPSKEETELEKIKLQVKKEETLLKKEEAKILKLKLKKNK